MGAGAWRPSGVLSDQNELGPASRAAAAPRGGEGSAQGGARGPRGPRRSRRPRSRAAAGNPPRASRSTRPERREPGACVTPGRSPGLPPSTHSPRSSQAKPESPRPARSSGPTRATRHPTAGVTGRATRLLRASRLCVLSPRCPAVRCPRGVRPTPGPGPTGCTGLSALASGYRGRAPPGTGPETAATPAALASVGATASPPTGGYVGTRQHQEPPRWALPRPLPGSGHRPPAAAPAYAHASVCLGVLLGASRPRKIPQDRPPGPFPRAASRGLGLHVAGSQFRGGPIQERRPEQATVRSTQSR